MRPTPRDKVKLERKVDVHDVVEVLVGVHGRGSGAPVTTASFPSRLNGLSA